MEELLTLLYCQSDAESFNHLLLHCLEWYQLWSHIFSLFGMMRVQHGSMIGVLWSWQGESCGEEEESVVFAPLCLMWMIWLERNRRTFHNMAIPFLCLRNRFLTILHSWVSGWVLSDLH